MRCCVLVSLTLALAGTPCLAQQASPDGNPPPSTSSVRLDAEAHPSVDASRAAPSDKGAQPASVATPAVDGATAAKAASVSVEATEAAAPARDAAPAQPGSPAKEAAAVPQDMKPPRITLIRPDWQAVKASLAVELKADLETAQSDVLAKLNAALPKPFASAAASPIPVLLPIDTAALLQDKAADRAVADGQKYLSGFHARAFFLAGPTGYDAALGIRTGEVPDLADIKFPDPIDVHITGSTLIYEIDNMPDIAGKPVPELESDFPGIRRMILEHYVRYTFERYGVPYVVSINCFDGRVSRYKMPTCRAADRVAVRFFRALRLVGGTPKPPQQPAPLAIARPATKSADFIYDAPGRLLPGTAFRDKGGRADDTVYSLIRFPMAAAPAYANSQMYRVRREPGQANSPSYAYPWRDNFCERRGFPVSQCPAGIGHQGQDIRPAQCSPEPCRSSHDLVAVRDGVVLRGLKQEAAYIVINTENEHIRFRYLHMNPGKMDQDGLLSGRIVHEGEVIGQVSNFSKKEGGTSYHLHFDVQAFTRKGWLFVNPYMTLVAAYERLIGARGVPLSEVIASNEPGAAALASPQVERPSGRRSRVRHARHRLKARATQGGTINVRPGAGQPAKKRRHVKTAKR